ncbi:MAG: ribokinase [Clostridia bacterium]|nr:ribokinase [Clostridia bacterium]
MKKILLIGSANMDLSMNMLRVPEPGETLIDDGGIAYTPGGKGANSAVAFAKLGADCVFCTKLGKDAHGQKLFNYYKECGINTSHIKVDAEAPTGLALVMKEADGSNRIVVYPGANTTLSNENIIEAFACNPDAVYLGFEIPFATAVAAAKIASAKNIPIFIDAAPASKEYPLESLPYLEVFSPNETETFEYTGIMPRGTESCLKAAHSLFTRLKAKYIVIKLGSRGAFVYDGKHYDLVAAYKPDAVVDTTAAGDTFTAGMTLEYLRSGNIKSAMRYGAAAAAIAVSRKGAGASVPTEAEVFDFIKRKGN